ncbi:MAG: CRISPR-associated endonuclease Cas2 [Bacteroidaceae bacterium]
MYILITYDVETVTSSGQKRLRQVAKACVNHGQRVQNSVFECLLDPAAFTKLKLHLQSLIDSEKDSIRFYLLGKNWEKRIETIGKETSFNVESELII